MKICWRLTSHGVVAGEAGADIDDEYISRTAQHYQPQPASENCTTVTLKRKEKLLKVTTNRFDSMITGRRRRTVL